MAPSMLCHFQAIPSISSYSARPARQRARKSPVLSHCRKYLCTELALPNRSLGNDFHWQPVLSTKTIPSNRTPLGHRLTATARLSPKWFAGLSFSLRNEWFHTLPELVRNFP